MHRQNSLGLSVAFIFYSKVDGRKETMEFRFQFKHFVFQVVKDKTASVDLGTCFYYRSTSHDWRHKMRKKKRSIWINALGKGWWFPLFIRANIFDFFYCAIEQQQQPTTIDWIWAWACDVIYHLEFRYFTIPQTWSYGSVNKFT